MLWQLPDPGVRLTNLSNFSSSDAASTFRDVWVDNFESVFAFTKLANSGIKGRVTDFKGNPLTGDMHGPGPELDLLSFCRVDGFSVHCLSFRLRKFKYKAWTGSLSTLRQFVQITLTLRWIGLNSEVCGYYDSMLIWQLSKSGVTIKISNISKTIKVRHPEGYYWRPVLEGTYQVTASKHGYYPLSRRYRYFIPYSEHN
jgi:hypothetical protein